MIQFKFNITEALKEKGIGQSYLIKNKILPASTVSKLRWGDTNISLDTLNTICLLLGKQPGDVIEEVATDEEKITYFQYR